MESILSILRHRLTRSTLQLQVGTTGALAVQALANIFIARLLGPDSFGVYAVAFSVASVASVVLGAGAVDALTPRATASWHEGDVRGVSAVVGYLVKFAFAAGLLALVVAAALPAVTMFVYHSSEAGVAAAAILGAALVSSLGLALLVLGLQLAGHLTRLSWLLFMDAAIRFGASVLLVAGGYGVIGAAAGQLVGALVMWVVVVVLWRDLTSAVSLWPGPRGALREARESVLATHLRPTLWVLADRNLAMVMGALPVALAGAFILAAEVASFKIALGYLTIGLSLLGPISTLMNVEFPRTLQVEPHAIAARFRRVSLAGLGTSAGITLGACIAAPVVIVFLYGQEFATAVPVVWSLALYAASFGIGVGLGPLWRALSKVKVSLIINSVTLAVGIPLGVVFLSRWGVWGASAMVTVWYLASQGASFWWLTRELERRRTA